MLCRKGLMEAEGTGKLMVYQMRFFRRSRVEKSTVNCSNNFYGFEAVMSCLAERMAFQQSTKSYCDNSGGDRNGKSPPLLYFRNGTEGLLVSL